MRALNCRLLLAAFALAAAGCSGGAGPGAGEVLGGRAVTHPQVQASIFTPNCATSGCHLGSGAPLGLDLSASRSLANTVGVPSTEMPRFDRVDPGNAADSYLFMKVTGDPRIQGDRMPAFALPLDDDKLQLLQDWIEQGANP